MRHEMETRRDEEYQEATGGLGAERKVIPWIERQWLLVEVSMCDVHLVQSRLSHQCQPRRPATATVACLQLHRFRGFALTHTKFRHATERFAHLSLVVVALLRLQP